MALCDSTSPLSPAPGTLLSRWLFRKEHQLLLQPSPGFSPSFPGRKALRPSSLLSGLTGFQHVLSHQRQTCPRQGPWFPPAAVSSEGDVAKQIILEDCNGSIIKVQHDFCGNQECPRPHLRGPGEAERPPPQPPAGPRQASGQVHTAGYCDVIIRAAIGTLLLLNTQHFLRPHGLRFTSAGRIRGTGRPGTDFTDD